MIDLLDQGASERALVEADTGELFTSWDWISVVADTYAMPVRAAVDRATGATLPLGLLDDLAGRRLIVLPFSDYVILPFELGTVIALADAALEALPAFSILIRLATAAPAATRGDWKIEQTAVYHRLEPASERERWEALAPAFRRVVRQGQRHGVTTRIDRSPAAMDRFYLFHAGLRNRKFALIPQPRRFFRLIHERFLARERGFILEAWHEETPVAACLVLHYGKRLYYKFGASLEAAGPIRANNVLLWDLIRLAAEHGLPLDFGRSGVSEAYAGLRRFKDSLGATSYPLYSLTHRAREPDAHAAERAAEFTRLAGRMSRLLAGAGMDESGNDAAAELLYRYFT